MINHRPVPVLIPHAGGEWKHWSPVPLKNAIRSLKTLTGHPDAIDEREKGKKIFQTERIAIEGPQNTPEYYVKSGCVEISGAAAD